MQRSRLIGSIVGALVTLAIARPMAALAGDTTTTLAIDGMHCGLCASAVIKALKQVGGVKTVEVSVSDKRAVVVADDSVQSDALVAAVGSAGFTAAVAAGR
jgi:copper chaperone CopZ